LQQFIFPFVADFSGLNIAEFSFWPVMASGLPSAIPRICLLSIATGSLLREACLSFLQIRLGTAFSRQIPSPLGKMIGLQPFLSRCLPNFKRQPVCRIYTGKAGRPTFFFSHHRHVDDFPPCMIRVGTKCLFRFLVGAAFLFTDFQVAQIFFFSKKEPDLFFLAIAAVPSFFPFFSGL